MLLTRPQPMMIDYKLAVVDEIEIKRVIFKSRSRRERERGVGE